MNVINRKLLRWTLGVCLAVAGCNETVYGDAPVATVAAPRLSVFIQPTNPREGCDPFFPDSSRPYAAFAPVVKKTTEAATLVIRGISGMEGHRVAVINNHAFAEGDTEDVLSNAGRVHVLCLKIEDNTVTVEVNGQRQLLTFKAK